MSWPAESLLVAPSIALALRHSRWLELHATFRAKTYFFTIIYASRISVDSIVTSFVISWFQNSVTSIFIKWTSTFNSWAKFCKDEELNCKWSFAILDLPAWKRLVVQIGKRSNAQSLWTARQSRCPRTSRTPWSSLEEETDLPRWRTSGDTRCSCRLSWAAVLWMASEMGSRHAIPRIRVCLKMQPITRFTLCVDLFCSWHLENECHALLFRFYVLSSKRLIPWRAGNPFSFQSDR